MHSFILINRLDYLFVFAFSHYHICQNKSICDYTFVVFHIFRSGIFSADEIRADKFSTDKFINQRTEYLLTFLIIVNIVKTDYKNVVYISCAQDNLLF